MLYRVGESGDQGLTEGTENVNGVLTVPVCVAIDALELRSTTSILTWAVELPELETVALTVLVSQVSYSVRQVYNTLTVCSASNIEVCDVIRWG